MIKFGDKLRVFVLSFVLSGWLFVIDGVNYSLNYAEDHSTDTWAKVLLLTTGYIFGIITLTGVIIVLFCRNARIGVLLIIFVCIFAGSARFIAVSIGFRDFWQSSSLDSTTNGTTDIAILCLQVCKYILCNV